MAIASWPASLGEIRGERSSFRISSLYQSPLQDQMDDGPPETRNRGIFRGTPLAITLLLTPAQLEAFIAFTTGDLGPNGAARFTAPVVGPDLNVSVKTCKIIGVPATAVRGNTWAVSFTLYVYGWGQP